MYNRRHPNITIWLLSLVSILTLGCSLACSSAGGTGISQTRFMQQESVEASVPVTSGQAEPAIEAMGAKLDTLRQEEFEKQEPCEHDPFGLMPVGWPEVIRLHPASRIAYSGRFGTEGYYLVTLISPGQATIPGVQTFHIETFATWESLQVVEEPLETGSETNRLTIVAEREGVWVKVISEQGNESVLTMLDDIGYWENTVGQTPIVVRVFYSPVAPPG